jgi:hypothetical protein
MTSLSFECTCILKSFCHFFVNFQKLLHSHLFVQFGLARVWRTRTACFRETCILRQNMWRSWWSMIHHILITHLHPTYHESISMDKRVTAWKKLFWVQVKLEEEKVLLKQYVSLHCFVEGKKLFIYIGHLNLEKPFCLNMQVSLKLAGLWHLV